MQNDNGTSSAGKTLDLVGSSLAESAIKKLDNALILCEIIGDMDAVDHIRHALDSINLFRSKYIVDES
jgi:hypothetical protein